MPSLRRSSSSSYRPRARTLAQMTGRCAMPLFAPFSRDEENIRDRVAIELEPWNEGVSRLDSSSSPTGAAPSRIKKRPLPFDVKISSARSAGSSTIVSEKALTFDTCLYSQGIARASTSKSWARIGASLGREKPGIGRLEQTPRQVVGSPNIEDRSSTGIDFHERRRSNARSTPRTRRRCSSWMFSTCCSLSTPPSIRSAPIERLGRVDLRRESPKQ